MGSAVKQAFEILAYKIGEGVQAAEISGSGQKVNLFQQTVTSHESQDLSFINGMITLGLRGCAQLSASKLISNFNQLLEANRHHLPLVVNTSTSDSADAVYGTLNSFEHLSAIRQTGCFQLIASSAQEEIYLTLIAHRIAELSLIPGVVIADHEKEEEPDFPEDHLISAYLGNPDDEIKCPTPAQEMIFGSKRRRIPNWFSLDLPAMIGTGKDSNAISLETAAISTFFNRHLQELIEQAYTEFNSLFKTNLQPVSSIHSKTGYALVSLGNRIKALAGELPRIEKQTDVISIQQVFPFPEKAFQDLIKKKKAITILEGMDHSCAARSSFYNSVKGATSNSGSTTYSGKCTSQLTAASLEKAIQHMISGQKRLDFYLGLEFTKKNSSSPIHRIELQEIEQNYPGIQKATINVERKGDPSPLNDRSAEVPLAIRMYKDKGPVYSRLSRFYNNTAVFYEYDQPAELVADPFAALPITPSLSAGFFSQAGKRTKIPELNTLNCTGCGDCFVHCPHSALPPVAQSLEQFIRTGIDMASAKGEVITKLQPLLKNLSKVAAKIILSTDVRTLKDFLPQAFRNLVIQLKLEGEKLKTVNREMDSVLTEIAELPIAITDDFFAIPNTVEKGSGELFSLIVDPTACNGCGICSEVCGQDALSMEDQDENKLERMINSFKLWERMPDTAGSTITRLHHDKSYSSLAAMFLSRSYYMTMSGANCSLEDAPYKTLLHIITAATESVVQPKIIQQIKQIDGLIDALLENIHDKLSNALPKDNLDQLSATLRQTHGKKLGLKDVVRQMDNQDEFLLDAEDLERKTELATALKNLRWSLAEGPTGVGRSRFGMLLAGSGSMDWTRQYPTNNFTGPSIIHWNGSAPEKSIGMFHGQLRYTLDNFRLLRKSELEVKDKYDPNLHDTEIAGLEWDQLSENEKQSIPPILLIAERDDLNESGWTGLNQLLAGKYPVKVFLLDHCASPEKDPVAALTLINSGLFSTIAQKSAFVFQGGLGNTEHLFDGLLGGLSKTYPAFFSLYATKQDKHGIQNTDWNLYAELAMNSRVFPALRYDPGEKSDFISGAISLDGNKAVDQNWVKEKVALADGKSIEYTITWADWALSQVDWKDEFMPLESKSKKLLLSEYIQLSNQARKNHRPAIMRSNEDGLKYYSVSPLVVEMTEAVLAYWRTLKEMSGLLTQFPMRLRTEITRELKVEYERKAIALKAEFDQKIKDQENAQSEILRQQLKDKLVALAGMVKKQSQE